MKKIFKIIITFIFSVVILFSAAFAALPLPGHIPILMYHFIDTPERAALEKNVVSAASFEKQVQFLKRFGYRVITLDEFYEIKSGVKKPRGREILITFDDGEYSFYQTALPILKKGNLPVSVFVISQNATQGLHGSMTAEQIKEISQDPIVTIGAHSRTHPILTEVAQEQIRSEVSGSKTEIEAMTQKPVHYFAYPVGRANQEVAQEVKNAGFRLAFTVSKNKTKDVGDPLYAIPRIKISRTSDFWFLFWIKISGIYEFFKKAPA